MPPFIHFIYSNELPDAVRRQLFWIIKRHTSYTAWARAFAASDRLFRTMESLLPELAGRPFGTYGLGLAPHTEPFNIWPNWEVWQEEHQNWQISLARLRNGDKGVLGYDSPRPYLPTMLSDIQYLLLFFLGEHPMDGYTPYLDPIIPQKRTLTLLAQEAYRKCQENIELTDTQMGSAGVDCQLNYSPEFKEIKRIGIYGEGGEQIDILTLYPIPANLPPVPEPVLLPSQNPPWWAPRGQKDGPLVFQTGERVFVPGIYLSEPYAMLHYISTNTPAPDLDVDEQRRHVDCAWTLIWLDDRYKDGVPIPEEEKLYFPDDEKIREPEGDRALPGEPCPRTGMWNAPNLPRVHHYVRQGEPMPGPKETELGSVIWLWLQEEPYPDKR